MTRTPLRVGVLVLLLAGLALQPAAAQTYSFRLDQQSVDVFFQDDGSVRLEYVFVFTNDEFASPMDYIDVGMPNDRYDLGSISASIDGAAISHIAPSEFVDPGVELGLGAAAIRPGATGTVRVVIGRVEDMLFAADIEGYASARFSPTWYDRQYVHGTTDTTVTFHLPPGVQPDEPRWFEVRGGWPSGDPLAFLDPEGRIAYQWRNPSANGYTQYQFGAAFPVTYVPAGVITQPSLFDRLNISLGAAMPCLCFSGMGLLFLGWAVLAVRIDRRRKMAYLPPKIAIEGHGIKRGLTAVEAAVLLETPLDRVLTMILFGVIKKNAARVVTEQPLTIEAIQPLPEDLHDYEKTFLEAALLPAGPERQKGLQKTMVDMVKAVQAKMKGFSLRETKDYYKSIMNKAWKQVEEAGTPEIRSQRYDEGLEWTMLDRDFDERTRRTFRTGPVFVPMWWGNFRPSSAPAMRPAGPAAPAGRPGGGVSLPHLPGADFAASMVTGVQNTAGRLVSNITDFTSGVTRTTNPPPPPPRAGKSSGWSGRSGGGGGISCACACACAGCACACAGGGR
jgi:hypothetical protein